jgi:hypothetical protein
VHLLGEAMVAVALLSLAVPAVGVLAREVMLAHAEAYGNQFPAYREHLRRETSQGGGGPCGRPQLRPAVRGISTADGLRRESSVSDFASVRCWIWPRSAPLMTTVWDKHRLSGVGRRLEYRSYADELATGNKHKKALRSTCGSEVIRTCSR